MILAKSTLKMQVINLIKDIKWEELYTGDVTKLILAVGSSTVIGLFSYLTLKIYLNHCKYSHIPGPPNQGYFIN